MKRMKAIAAKESLPITDERALVDVTLEEPELRPHDLLVAVRAVSVNPVDWKIRLSPRDPEAPPQVLGWDAAGEVVAVGPEAKGFAVGDRVYYAGDITRPGTNAERHAIDSRIAAKMPASLDFADAAGLPLTSLTAWESLFERIGVATDGSDEGKRLLIVGGAGGVGSMAIQLAKRVAGLRVIATASRPESIEWVKGLGADDVIDHHQPLDEGVASVTEDGRVEYILCLNSTGAHWDAMCRAIAPQGTIATIVETDEPLDMELLKLKSARLAWELMFTRSMFETDDIAEQGAILARTANLVDDGVVRGTVTTKLSPIDAATLREAHAKVESGRTIGKVVVSGWE